MYCRLNTMIVLNIYPRILNLLVNKLFETILKIQQYIVQLNYRTRTLTSIFLFACIEDELEPAIGVTCDVTGLMSKSLLIHTCSKNRKCSREYFWLLKLHSKLEVRHNCIKITGF